MSKVFIITIHETLSIPVTRVVRDILSFLTRFMPVLKNVSDPDRYDYFIENFTI